MEGNYCEANAKKKKTGTDSIIKFALFAGIALTVVASFVLTMSYLLIIAVALGIFAYVYIPRLNVEYEYVFCDGQIDIDKIMSGEKRKHLATIDMEQVVVAAPKNSHALDGYKREGVKTYDYSSLEDNGNTWALVTTMGEQTSVYYFEPSDVMKQKMKQKAPRKVVEY